MINLILTNSCFIVLFRSPSRGRKMSYRDSDRDRERRRDREDREDRRDRYDALICYFLKENEQFQNVLLFYVQH